MISDNLLTESDTVINTVLTSIQRNESLLLTYLNQHSFNIYNKDQSYSNLMNSKFTVYQADLGMYLALRFLKINVSEKIDGTSLNEKILNQIIEKKVPIVIIGGNFDEEFILDESKMRNINLVFYQNGYFENSECDKIFSKLAGKEFQVCLIGMGVPKQEFFSEKLLNAFPGKVIICVGNFLEFYFGIQRRAPEFIRKIGLEWLFRLFTEPGRLWKRYILGIPFFLYLIIKYRINEKFSKKKSNFI